MSVTYRLIPEVTVGPKSMILWITDNPVFSFLNRVIFDLGEIYVIILKKGGNNKYLTLYPNNERGFLIIFLKMLQLASYPRLFAFDYLIKKDPQH